MSDESKRPSWNAWQWASLLLAVYVAGFGPAAKYYMTSPGAKIKEALFTAYTPILWLMEYTPLEKPFELYLKLWGVNF